MVNDTVGDAITRIRNAYLAGRESIEMPYSGLSKSVAELLKEHGYLSAVDATPKVLKLTLAYQDQVPALTGIVRVSKPGRRITTSARRLPRVLDGYGIAIVSTSQGLMTDKEARKKNIGGEILLTVY